MEYLYGETESYVQRSDRRADVDGVIINPIIRNKFEATEQCNLANSF
jgi:hypothetical protein